MVAYKLLSEIKCSDLRSHGMHASHHGIGVGKGSLLEKGSFQKGSLLEILEILESPESV